MASRDPSAVTQGRRTRRCVSTAGNRRPAPILLFAALGTRTPLNAPDSLRGETPVTFACATDAPSFIIYSWGVTRRSLDASARPTDATEGPPSRATTGCSAAAAQGLGIALFREA